jgi:hypothetical protein
MIKEMQPYVGHFLIALQALFPFFSEIIFPLKTLVFKICVSFYLIRKNSIASLINPLKHKISKVVLVISGLGWRNYEPGSGIVS